MSLLTIGRTTVRRVSITFAVAAVAAAGVAGPASAAVDGPDAPTIDTYSGWDGSSYLYPFGAPDTSTYGQVVTVPDGKKKLKYFSFYQATADGYPSGTILLRGEVYGWDGTKATTEVWESAKAKKLKLTAGDPEFQQVKFKTKGAKLKPGQQYVMFATISKDYEEQTSGVASKWATNYSDVLPGGYTVYINDTGDEGRWTTEAWSQITTYDFAMKASIK